MKKNVNNAFYDELHQMWLNAEDHPIAVLRSENRLRNPWISRVIEKELGGQARVLDVGCGGGLLTNHLAKEGYEVSGIDLSKASLDVAEQSDPTNSAKYLCANACELPFDDGSFDVVCAMDLLEHVEHPELVISEAARVLRPRGIFFFHTFNRTLLSYLLAIKALEWFIPNAPKDIHIYNLFIKPKELQKLCQQVGMKVESMNGVRPCLTAKVVKQVLFEKRVTEDFIFEFCKSLKAGYCGYAISQ